MSATFDGLWSVDRDRERRKLPLPANQADGSSSRGSGTGGGGGTGGTSAHDRDNLINGHRQNDRMSNYYHPGMHSNPAYQGEKHRNDAVVVPMSGSSGVNLLPQQPKWSWCSMGWAVFTSICCASLCGWMGLLCSVLSYTDHKSADYDRARYKRRWSWCCTMTGLFLSLIVIAAILIFIFVFAQQLAPQLCPYYRSLGIATLNEYCKNNA